MEKFSKNKFKEAINRRAAAIGAKYGFDPERGEEQIASDADQDTLFQFAEWTVCLDMNSETKVTPYVKATIIWALQSLAKIKCEEFKFDLNNGTSQLKGRLATQEATIAYGQMRFASNLATWVDVGSFLR